MGYVGAGGHTSAVVQAPELGWAVRWGRRPGVASGRVDVRRDRHRRRRRDPARGDRGARQPQRRARHGDGEERGVHVAAGDGIAQHHDRHRARQHAEHGAHQERQHPHLGHTRGVVQHRERHHRHQPQRDHGEQPAVVQPRPNPGEGGPVGVPLHHRTADPAHQPVGGERGQRRAGDRQHQTPHGPEQHARGDGEDRAGQRGDRDDGLQEHEQQRRPRPGRGDLGAHARHAAPVHRDQADDDRAEHGHRRGHEPPPSHIDQRYRPRPGTRRADGEIAASRTSRAACHPRCAARHDHQRAAVPGSAGCPPRGRG